MLKTMLVALAMVTFLSTVPFVQRAEATVVCGSAGCAPVQVKKMQKHRMPTPGPVSVPARPAS